MANKRFIDFPIATTVGDNDIILIWQGGANKQTTKATILSGVPDSLNDLTDVTISGLTNGQILRYDSVTGQWENTDQGNLDLNDLNDVTIVSPTNGQVLVYNSSTGKWENSSGGYVPYVGAVTTVNLGAQSIQAGSFVKQGGTASQFLKADGSVDSTAYGTGSVTSVGLTMPAAFNVANSPITTSGTLAVTGAGTVGQYIRGDGSLADFPQSSGGGSSVSYYLNGSVDQGTIGGIAYKELSKVPILGAGTDFTINADGYIASFITDAGDPSLLEIPGGNWNFETYFSASSSGGTPTFYVELYKVSSGGTATLIASSSSAPELIAFGTNLNPYFSTLAVPTTTLALTDRLAVRYYVTHSGRTITLHTENNHLCQIVTTFTTGITALNGLTAQVQNFAVGTTGTDFNIASATATHTFNLPTASATNRGALSSADWSLFTQAYNDKINSAAVTGTTTKTLTLTQQDGGTITASWSDLNTDAVLSVFGRTGAVVAANGDYTTAQVTESGNLYYTDARSRAALSFAAGSGAYNTSTGVITIPTNNNQITNGAGYITSAALAGYLPLSGGVMTGPITTPNGTFGIVIGDDSRLADRNIANTLFLEGVQNNDRGYINFSQTTGNALGAINGGDLTWRGNIVLHAANFNSYAPTLIGGGASGNWAINITGNSTAVINTVTGTNSAELVRGNMADNDQFRILVGGTASNAGFAEIATADDGTEPIHVRQYTGTFATLIRTATLLDGSGNTILPGSLGIGTNDPKRGLHVSGTASSAEFVLSNTAMAVNAKNLNIWGNPATGFWNIRTLTDDFNSTAVSFINFVPSTGNVIINSNSDNGEKFQVTGNARINGGASTALRLDANSGVTALNIGGTGNLLVDAPGIGGGRFIINTAGNVGIGTNAPTAIGNYKSLTLDGTDGSIVDLRFNSNANGRIYSSSDAAVGIESLSTTLPLIFKTQNGSGSLERMRVTPSGDVGIGNWSTNVPQDRLHVNGAIQVGFVNSLNSALRIFWNGASSYGAIQTSSSSALALNPSGNNVLIGTTSDNGARLQVSGTASVGTLNVNTTTSGERINVNGAIGFQNSSSVQKFHLGYFNGGLNFTESAVADYRLFIKDGGNVGIGTPSPQDRLDVNGSIRFRANTPNFTEVTDNGVLDYVPTSVFATTPTVRIASIGTASVGGQIRFLTGTSSSLDTRMTITSSGNVLVNTTTSTGATLEVNGTIRTGTLDTGYVSGFWKLGRAVTGTQPTNTHQIIVEINGLLYVIPAALL